MLRLGLHQLDLKSKQNCQNVTEPRIIIELGSCGPGGTWHCLNVLLQERTFQSILESDIGKEQTLDVASHYLGAGVPLGVVFEECEGL